MQKRYKILLNSYTCSPYRGSEPGMGWNFIKGLSQYHELHVIVEKEKWEQDINKYLKENPDFGKNIKFYFIRKKRARLLRKIWPPSYYWFYRQWHKKVYNLALELNEKINFDIIHQLNMVGYREPGFLWKIDKPFVWGPIGGLENSPWRFLPSLGFYGFIFYSARNIINLWQQKFLVRPQLAAKRRNSILISATKSNAVVAKRIWNVDSFIISEVGQLNGKSSKILNIREKAKPLKIIWSGLHTPRKNLPLLLKALKNIDINYELHILGEGKETNKWKTIAQKLKVDKHCIWYGWLKRDSAINVMRKGHLFCITSISDLTSTVLLEALSYGLPVITLNHCGFADVINDSCGIKISVTNPKKASLDFFNAIKKLYENEDYRQMLSKGAVERARDYSWDKKIKKLNTIYNKLINE